MWMPGAMHGVGHEWQRRSASVSRGMLQQSMSIGWIKSRNHKAGTLQHTRPVLERTPSQLTHKTVYCYT